MTEYDPTNDPCWMCQKCTCLGCENLMTALYENVFDGSGAYTGGVSDTLI